MEGGLGLAASKPLSWSTSRWTSSSSNILISISKVPPLVPSEGKVYFFVRFPKEFAQQTTLIPYNLVQLSTNHYGYEKITAWVQVTPVAGSTSSRPGSGRTLMSTITTGDHGEKYSSYEFFSLLILIIIWGNNFSLHNKNILHGPFESY